MNEPTESFSTTTGCSPSELYCRGGAGGRIERLPIGDQRTEQVADDAGIIAIKRSRSIDRELDRVHLPDDQVEGLRDGDEGVAHDPDIAVPFDQG